MLALALKKMINNPWMSLFLLIGFILAVAMMSSIPLYTNGILQKMLIDDMENYQNESGQFPGYYTLTANLQYQNEEQRINSYRNLRHNIRESLIPQLFLPVKSISEDVYIKNYSALRKGTEKLRNAQGGNISLRTRPDIVSHITITNGRIFNSSITDETAEVIVTEEFLKQNGFLLNDTLIIDTKNGEPYSRLKIVGIFKPSDYQDTYWRRKSLAVQAYLDYSLYEQEILGKNLNLIYNAEWVAALDYHALTVKNLDNFVSVLEKHYELASDYGNLLEISFQAETILEQYNARENQLRTTLWIIQVPVFILLFFYIFMITNLVIRSEKNEIAVYKSRGMSRSQVFLIYLIEGFILSAAALITGPPLGFLICRFMGASNGFLEFVKRSPIEISLSCEAYFFSVITLLFLLVTMLVPAWLSSGQSIVQVKQEKARDFGKPFWQKFSLDFLMLIVCGYGYYRYATRQEILSLAGVSSADIAIDPILFLTSTLFILGTGLLFLRFFPLFVKLILKIGSRSWSPGMYCALIEVSRTGKQGQFLMLFLIFSIAIGFFDTNMARTLNRNIEDKTRYSAGAEIRLQQRWLQDHKTELDITSGFGEKMKSYVIETHYKEPSFSVFEDLEGASLATKVFNTPSGRVYSGGKTLDNIRIMGIIPNEFGKLAWFRNDLLPYHWYNYLNLLTKAPNALLVSSDMKESLNLDVGDSIQFEWGDQDYISGIIYAFVDYWPTFNPYTDDNKKNNLVVANLSYLHNKSVKEPYEVWIKKEEGISDADFYRILEDKIPGLTSLQSMSQMLIKRKNDPLLKGINGALTQGFLLIMIICTIGFLIYWTLSLKNRTLQFGILRAIGLSRREVTSIIILEQIMMSGTAIIAGILTGRLASTFFVPFLQLVFSQAEQVPPFIVVTRQSDYLRIFIIITVMLGTGFILLSRFMKRLKVGAELKLGED